MPRWTEKEVEILREEYPYIPTSRLCKPLKRRAKSIREKARSLGIRKIEHNKKYINHFYLDNWSSDVAWLLGFWAADGCAYHGKYGKKVIIFVQSEKEILESIRACLKSEHKISTQSNDLGTWFSFRFVSRRMYDRIQDIFGCEIQHKSLSLCYPHIPIEYSRDFIRGVIDGDGCITYCGGIPTISCCSGSLNFITGIVQEIYNAIGIKRKIGYGNGNTYAVSYNANKARILARWLYYRNDLLSLERKKRKARRFTSNE